MNDPSAVGRLVKLKALEEWLAWQLENTRRKIADLERQTATYVVEKAVHEGHPMGATVHTADCTMVDRPTNTVDADTARQVLTKDARFFKACEFCDPGKMLGLDTPKRPAG